MSHVVGWTPCQHHSECIGYCPLCLAEETAKQTVEPFIGISINIDQDGASLVKIIGDSQNMMNLATEHYHEVRRATRRR